MVARLYNPESAVAGNEILAIAEDVCLTLIAKHGYHSRFGAAGFIECLSVLGVKVRLVYRSDLDYSLGTDDWNVRFRHKPLAMTGATLRGHDDAFNRDMTVFKMVGAPYTLD